MKYQLLDKNSVLLIDISIASFSSLSTASIYDFLK